MESRLARIGEYSTVLNLTPVSERVRWQQADALGLPFEDSAFDAIVCQFGVMFFPDKQTAFREALRVLKPRGRFLFEG